MEHDKIMIEKNAFICGTHAIISGSVPIPKEAEEHFTVLDITALAEIKDVEARDGFALINGTLRLTILYTDHSNQFNSFDAECEFDHTADACEIDPQMQLLAFASLGEISYRCENNTVFITSELFLDLTASCNTALPLLSPEGLSEAELLTEACNLPVLTCLKQAKSYVKQELRIPQSMPQAEKILLFYGYPSITHIDKELERIVVEGELHVSIVYRSNDKNAPLQYFFDTVPFGEIIKDPDICDDHTICANAYLEKILVEENPASTDLLSLSAVIAINLHAQTNHTYPVITDAYFLEKASELDISSLTFCRPQAIEKQKKILRLPLSIPETLPEATRILYAHSFIEHSGVVSDDSRLYIDGVAHVTICYTTRNLGINSACLKTPFEVSFSNTSEGEALIHLNSEYTLIEGSGRDLDAKIAIELSGIICKKETTEAVSNITLTGPSNKLSPGMIVYFAQEGESLFSIAKKHCVPVNHLKCLDESGANLKNGSRIAIIV